MRKRLFLNAALIGTALAAQQSYVYTNPDHTFQFSIPIDYRVYDSDLESHPVSYIPMCRGGDTACIVYTGHKYAKTNFSAASIEVIISPASDALSCGIASGRHPEKTMGGIQFVHSTEGAGAMSHDIERDIYLGFANGKCFEMDLNIAYINIHAWDPGGIPEFTKSDYNRVHTELLKIAESLKPLR